jgi:hypothetical protein
MFSTYRTAKLACLAAALSLPLALTAWNGAMTPQRRPRRLHRR